MSKDQAISYETKRAEITVLFKAGKTYYDIIHYHNHTKYMTNIIKDQLFPKAGIKIPDATINNKGLFNWDLVKNNDIFGIGQFIN